MSQGGRRFEGPHRVVDPLGILDEESRSFFSLCNFAILGLCIFAALLTVETNPTECSVGGRELVCDRFRGTGFQCEVEYPPDIFFLGCGGQEQCQSEFEFDICNPQDVMNATEGFMPSSCHVGLPVRSEEGGEVVGCVDGIRTEGTGCTNMCLSGGEGECSRGGECTGECADSICEVDEDCFQLGGGVDILVPPPFTVPGDPLMCGTDAVPKYDRFAKCHRNKCHYTVLENPCFYSTFVHIGGQLQDTGPLGGQGPAFPWPCTTPIAPLMTKSLVDFRYSECIEPAGFYCYVRSRVQGVQFQHACSAKHKSTPFTMFYNPVSNYAYGEEDLGIFGQNEVYGMWGTYWPAPNANSSSTLTNHPPVANNLPGGWGSPLRAADSSECTRGFCYDKLTNHLANPFGLGHNLPRSVQQEGAVRLRSQVQGAMGTRSWHGNNGIPHRSVSQTEEELAPPEAGPSVLPGIVNEILHPQHWQQPSAAPKKDNSEQEWEKAHSIKV